MNEHVELAITDEAPEGKINEASMAAARALIGSKLRPEQYLRDASVDSLTIFANGIGDLNPLYRDLEYARWTRFGGLIGHPCFPWTHHWPGRSYWGLPGVHGFGVMIDCEYFRNVRPDDRINIWNRVIDIQEKPSKFSGKMAMQYLESTYTNQRDEVLCKTLGMTARHERKASRDTNKYKDVKTHSYTDEDIARIEEQVMTEPSRIRGAVTRHWEDVNVGDKIDEIARGPLSMSDTMAFVIGSGRGAAHGALLKHAAKHPKHYVRNKHGQGVEYTGIGHHRENFAREVGVPGMYDYLPQRACWFATAITNWMGDDAVLKRLRMEARKFNIQGDTTFIGGTVVKKYVKDRCALVDIEMKGVNQSGELTSPGFATVMLASKDVSTRVPLNGAVVDLDLATVR
jgi:acyl dehydratase